MIKVRIGELLNFKSSDDAALLCDGEVGGHGSFSADAGGKARD